MVNINWETIILTKFLRQKFGK